MEQNKDLLKVSINSIPFDKCQKGYTDIKGLENGISEQNMICAGRLEGGKDTCLVRTTIFVINYLNSLLLVYTLILL